MQNKISGVNESCLLLSFCSAILNVLKIEGVFIILQDFSTRFDSLRTLNSGLPNLLNVENVCVPT